MEKRKTFPHFHFISYDEFYYALSCTFTLLMQAERFSQLDMYETRTEWNELRHPLLFHIYEIVLASRNNFSHYVILLCLSLFDLNLLNVWVSHTSTVFFFFLPFDVWFACKDYAPFWYEIKLKRHADERNFLSKKGTRSRAYWFTN